METAEDSGKTRGNRWLTVGVVNITHTFAHLNLGALPVLYPLLREEFAFGYTGIAVLDVINQVIRGPVQFSFGFLSRFINRILVLAIGALVTFGGMLGFSGSQNYYHLVATRTIWGFGATPNDPLGGAVTADNFPRFRTRALAWHLTAVNIGTWIAPLLVAWMLTLPYLDWQWIIRILAVPVVLISLLLFFLKDPSSRGETGGTRRGRARAGLAEYKMVLRDRNTMIVAAIMAIGAAGRGLGLLQVYLPTFVVDRFGASVPFAATLLATYTFGGLLGPLTMGWIADRTSPHLVLRVTLLLSAVFALLFLAVPTAGVAPTSTAGIALYAVVFFAGLFMHARGVLTQSMLIGLAPEGVSTDTLLSVYAGLQGLTGPVWIFASGVVVDNFGIPPAFWLMAVSYIGGIVLLGLIKRNPRQPEP